MKDNDIINYIRNNTSDKRFRHIEGVVSTAVEIAARENLSIEKAKTAALLHDVAKNMPKKKLIKMANNSQWDIDRYEQLKPSLLHGPAGAYIAKKKFDIDDYNILEAIRYHTVGSPQMGKLALVIFVADMIEPGRDFDGIAELRSLAKVNLIDCVIAVCDYCLKYNINKRRIIHPNTLLLRNKYLGGK